MTHRRKVLVLGLAGAVLGMAATGSRLHAADVFLTASTATPTAGSSFAVIVNVQGVAPFANWGAFLRFDPAKLALTAQAAGTFSTFVADSRGLVSCNGTGEVRAGGYRLGNNAGGGGTLAVFTFRALAAGSTLITTENKSVANPFGNTLVPSSGAPVLPNSLGPLAITIGGEAGGVKSDFNADRKADILMRHPSDGAVSLWLMNGTGLPLYLEASGPFSKP